jgi:integrase
MPAPIMADNIRWTRSPSPAGGGALTIFCREDRHQLDRYGLRWRVKKAYRAAGLKITDPYSMRHTFASLMDYAGETHQTIADMMGHRNVTTFEVVYRHNLRPVVKGTRSALAGIVG